MDSLAFMQNPAQAGIQSIYVLHGDEDFLKRQVVAALRTLVLGAEDNSFGLSTYAGDNAEFAAVHDELQTLPFLGSRRLVVVENADAFVTNFRPLLEKYAGQPAATGVLVLDVTTWPGNTRLAKLIPSAGTIVCKAPAPYKVADWCVQWAASQHGKQLTAAAARLLVELVGTEMGQLDQELLKLAIYVASARRISEEDVDKLVGSSRGEKMWKIFDAIGAGQSGEALRILDRLFDQGEEPLRILGAFSMQLRRLAQVARLHEQGQPLPAAVNEAGVLPFAQKSTEQQLRHLGRARVDRLYDWLVETDLGLKGSSQLPPRTLLERLVVRLAQKV
jgi:DNA polymerase III subunit delta